MSAREHDINCEWQHDQYDFECCCGATRPRAPWFQPAASQVDERSPAAPEQPATPVKD